MKRFYNDDPDEFFENTNSEDHEDLDEDEIHEIDEEFMNFIDEERLVEVIHAHVDNSLSKDNILDLAVQIAEKRLFWRFYSRKHQLNIVRNTYQELLDIQLST